MKKKVKNFSSRQITHKKKKNPSIWFISQGSLKSMWKQISAKIPGWLLMVTLKEISEKFQRQLLNKSVTILTAISISLEGG